MRSALVPVTTTKKLLPLLIVLAIALEAAAKEPSAPPSVSCLGPEGESYLRGLLDRIRQLEGQLDAEMEAHLTERAAAERRLQSLAAERSRQADAVAEQMRTRAAELDAAKRRLEKVEGFDPEEAKKELVALKAALEQATAARRKAESEVVEAQRKAREEVAKAACDSEEEAAAEAKLPKPPPPSSGAPGSRLQDDERARDVARQRAAAPETARIAPGDRLAIRVEHMDEVCRTVEVASDGQIELPLLGRVPAAGRNQGELVADLAERLTAYMQTPEVDVALQRGAQEPQVTVDGAVGRPGAYPLPAGSTTILEVIAHAGGRTRAAASVVELTRAKAKGEAGATAEQPIVVNLTPAGGAEVKLPVAAGDHIHVPEIQLCTVEGWVASPGVYEVTRRSTVTAAIAAAGGSLFAGNLRDVEVRHADGAEPKTVLVDVESIAAGESTDEPLHAGDVVRVPASAPRVLPWSIYAGVSGVVRVVTFPFWYPFS
jgi:polysaccharide biosynthesis/export protein